MKATGFVAWLKDKRFFHPILIGDINQCKGPNHIGLYKDARILDRIIDMTLRGKMNNAANIIFSK